MSNMSRKLTTINTPMQSQVDLYPYGIKRDSVLRFAYILLGEEGRRNTTLGLDTSSTYALRTMGRICRTWSQTWYRSKSKTLKSHLQLESQSFSRRNHTLLNTFCP